MTVTPQMRRWRKPQWSRRVLRRTLAALVIALLAGMGGATLQIAEWQAIYPSGPLHALESAAQDAVLRTRNPNEYGSSVGKDPRQLITIVSMDERSLAELGVFRLWPRSYYAQVLEQLLSTPPRVVVFDVGFFESSSDDAQLAAAFKRAADQRPATGVAIAAAGGGVATRGPQGGLRFSEGLSPVQSLTTAADIGTTNVVPDDRGIVRSMPLVSEVGSVERPTLGLIAVAKYLRRPTFVDGRPDADTFLIAGRQIPVDATTSVSINFFGPPSRPEAPPTTFNTVSFVDVLRGRVDPQTWRDGIVFVGLLGAAGFADDYWTPVSQQGLKMSGVEVHANVAATLISTQFLRHAPIGVEVGLILVLALLVGGLSALPHIARASVATLAVLAGYVLANLVTLDSTGLQLALAYPVSAAALTFVGVIAYRVGVEQRHSRALQTALASVIPPSVAVEIARDPHRVRMGGERRTMTVLFTDLKGFTTFSETVDPEVLGRVIGRYLDAMTSVVFQHGGTLDKFIGDAVMAFWNAPLDEPEHALRACQAALDMQATLERLNDEWQSHGLPRQYMRIGINTGAASVGNMGSSRRFAYTALGDAVNLAARLEPLNNEYGTRICISQATLDAAGGRHAFIARYLDLVAVKGKREAVPVYELLGRRDDAAVAARYEPIFEYYNRAVVLYQARQFNEAAELFNRALAITNGDDGPSAVYVERCMELAAEPPAPDWDLVYVMKHK
jgi:adenylate cyclase